MTGTNTIRVLWMKKFFLYFFNFRLYFNFVHFNSIRKISMSEKRMETLYCKRGFTEEIIFQIIAI